MTFGLSRGDRTRIGATARSVVSPDSATLIEGGGLEVPLQQVRGDCAMSLKILWRLVKRAAAPRMPAAFMCLLVALMQLGTSLHAQVTPASQTKTCNYEGGPVCHGPAPYDSPWQWTLDPTTTSEITTRRSEDTLSQIRSGSRAGATQRTATQGRILFQTLIHLASTARPLEERRPAAILVGQHSRFQLHLVFRPIWGQMALLIFFSITAMT
jgi:hypothetical protein